MFWYEELSLEEEIVLMIECLKLESPNELNENNLNKNKSDINSPKGMEYSEDEPTISKLEENDYESSYTEEKVLKDIYSYNVDIKKESKNKGNFLKKKRKKDEEDETNEPKNLNYINQQIGNKSNLTNNENGKKEINSDPLDSDMEIINKFDAEIPYEYRVESEDDEACI